MPTLFVLSGMPGSGKSTKMKEFKQMGLPIFDDYHAGSRNHSEEIEDAQRFNEFRQCLEEGKDCLLVEVAYCWERRRQKLVKFMAAYPSFNIDWQSYEHNFRQCLINILKRDRENWESEILLAVRMHFTNYGKLPSFEPHTFPAGVTPIKVWDGAKIVAPENANPSS